MPHWITDLEIQVMWSSKGEDNWFISKSYGAYLDHSVDATWITALEIQAICSSKGEDNWFISKSYGAYLDHSFDATLDHCTRDPGNMFIKRGRQLVYK